jgi:hypothetical protein
MRSARNRTNRGVEITGLHRRLDGAPPSNQLLTLTGAALRFRVTQPQCSGPGKLAIAFAGLANGASTRVRRPSCKGEDVDLHGFGVRIAPVSGGCNPIPGR